MFKLPFKTKPEYNNEELTDFLVKQVWWDSNERSSVTGRELTKRIKGYNRVDCPANSIWVLSCLRLSNVYYYKEKHGEKYGTPICEAIGNKIIFAFSTPKHLQCERLEECTVSKAPFREFFRNYKKGTDKVVINPFTNAFIMRTGVIDEIFSLMDSVEKRVDAEMAQGIQKENLHDFVFWRFCKRNLFCKLRNGTELVGYARNSLFEKDYCLEVITKSGKVVTIMKPDVEFIKEIDSAAQ